MTQNGLIPVCQKMKGIFKQDLLEIDPRQVM